jgi:hypothetical protein
MAGPILYLLLLLLGLSCDPLLSWALWFFFFYADFLFLCMVTSRISLPVLSFGGAHRGRVYVRVFIGVSVRACLERLRCTV